MGDSVDEPDPRVARSRARITEATIELIVEAGTQALTMEAVAERSGVAKTTLYRHWSSLEELVVDVFREAVPPPPALDDGRSFEELLGDYMAGFAATLADERWSRIVPDLLALGVRNPEIAMIAADDRAANEAVLAAIVERGEAEGRLPPGLDPELVGTLLLGPVVLSAVLGDIDRLQDVASFAVERFLASYET